MRFLFFCSEGVVEAELVLGRVVVAPGADDKSGDPSSAELPEVGSMAPLSAFRALWPEHKY